MPQRGRNLAEAPLLGPRKTPPKLPIILGRIHVMDGAETTSGLFSQWTYE